MVKSHRSILDMINIKNRRKQFDFYHVVLRRTVQNWYVEVKTAPTLRRIHRKFHEGVKYTGGRES